MKNKTIIVSFCFVVFGFLKAHADVIDMTDPKNPIIISSGTYYDLQSDTSFDCKKAGTVAEKLICSNDDLAASDQKIANLYHGLGNCYSKDQMDTIRKAQKTWISKRASCADGSVDQSDAIQCIAESYDQRIRELTNLNTTCVSISTSSVNPSALVYLNRKFGFEITFPKEMHVSEDFVGSYHVQDNVWSQRYWQFGMKDKGIPVVSVIAYPATGRPMVELRIGVHAGTSTLTACGWSENDTSLSTIILDQYPFRRFDLSGAGMMKFVESESYQIFNQGYCFAIERIRIGSNYYEEDTKKKVQATNAESQLYYEKTEAIAKSFKFE